MQDPENWGSVIELARKKTIYLSLRSKSYYSLQLPCADLVIEGFLGHDADVVVVVVGFVRAAQPPVTLQVMIQLVKDPVPVSERLMITLEHMIPEKH